MICLIWILEENGKTIFNKELFSGTPKEVLVNPERILDSIPEENETWLLEESLEKPLEIPTEEYF